MEKKIDGIKKLSSDELKKYRKQVLDFIGEKDQPAEGIKKITGSLPARKSVDGLKVNRPVDMKAAIKKQAEARKQIKEEERQFLLKQEREEKERVSRSLREAREKAAREEEKKRLENIKLAEKAAEKKRLAEEILRREEAERQAKAEKTRELVRQEKKREAEKRKIRRLKAFRKFKSGLAIKFKEVLSAVKRNLIFGLFILTMIAVIGYLALCLAILRFKADGAAISAITGFLPVPAVISDQGMIGYNDFKLLAGSNDLGRTSEQKKKNLAQWIILRNLKQKYNLPLSAADDELAVKFAADEDFNQVGLSRIKKISRLLAAGGSMDQLSKYADVYFSGADGAAAIGNEALASAAGEPGDIIYRADGYYLAEKLSGKDGSFSLRYIFVAANTLSQYLQEKELITKLFILAN